MLRHLIATIFLTLCIALAIAKVPLDADRSKLADADLPKKSNIEDADDLQADATYWGGYGGYGRGYYGGGYGRGYYGGGYGGRGYGDYGRGYYGGWGGNRGYGYYG